MVVVDLENPPPAYVSVTDGLNTYNVYSHPSSPPAPDIQSPPAVIFSPVENDPPMYDTQPPITNATTSNPSRPRNSPITPIPSQRERVTLTKKRSSDVKCGLRSYKLMFLLLIILPIMLPTLDPEAPSSTSTPLVFETISKGRVLNEREEERK
ncbi:hypothetical protein Clacol_005356 [Clathrus columnatus]|uniref:Transmembrane protein n=1 Tax=Clathrus columnatus TaxID=1419009 RepID=A0AAV5AGQ9_9AGAM|nr:hypothetical protein Clacol_005356 [Clathrus columnatus]